MIEFPSTTVVNRLLPKDKFIEHLDLSPNLKKKLVSDIIHIRVLNKFSKSVLNFREELDEVECSKSLHLRGGVRRMSDGRVTEFVVNHNSLEQTSSQAENEFDNTLSLNRVSSGSVTPQSAKADSSPQVEPLEKTITEVLLLQIELKKHDFDSKLIEAIAKQNSHKLVFLLRFEKYAKLAVYYKQLYIGKWKPFEELSLVLKGNSVNEVWLSFVEQIALDESNAISKSDLDHKLELQNKAKALEKEIAKLDTAIRKERQPNRKFELHKKLLQLEESLKALGCRA